MRNKYYNKGQLLQTLQTNPEYHISALFTGVSHRKDGHRIYFDAPNFNSWDYHLITNICKDFRNGRSFNLISLYGHFFTNGDYKLAAREIESKLNLEGSFNKTIRPVSKQSLESKVYNDEVILKICQSILHQSIDAKGTIVDQYLINRGITLLTPIIRYHPNLRHKATGKYFPAMVAGITIWPSPDIVGLHRTYLSPDGSGKADLEINKMMLGKTKGGAVQLLPATMNKINIAEGIETALSVCLLTGIPTWAALSTDGMESIIVPPVDQVQEIEIWADNDEAGIKAANKLKARLLKEGYTVNIVLPEQEGWDFNDVLLGGQNDF